MTDEESLELEQMDDLVHSAGFRVFQKRMITARETKLRELVQPSSPEKTAEIRGGIAMLEMCLRLPGQIRSELRDGRQKRRTTK